jgi:HSP20 family protein
MKTAEKEAERAPVHRGWPPMESIRRDLNRLFEDFGDLWRSPLRQGLLGAEPLWSRELTWAAMLALDVAEQDKAYEITAELPGMDDKNIEVKVANGMLTIRGEKKEE